MQTMIDKRFSISLTATIAELYETQKHYYAAYIVYWFLYQTEKKEQYHTKLNDIKEKIYNSDELRFDQTITQLFSMNDLKELGILPKNLYKHFADADADLQKDDDEAASKTEPAEGDDFRHLGKEIGMEWQRIIDEERTARKDKLDSGQETDIDLEKCDRFKVSEFINYLDKFKTENKSMDELKLSSMIESFIKDYNPQSSGNQDPD